MKEIKRLISFSLEKRKKKDVLITSNVPIRVLISWTGQRYLSSTGHRIDAKAWDETKQKVKQGYTNKTGQTYSDINSGLSRINQSVDELFKKHELAGTIPTIHDIRQALDRLPKEEKKLLPEEITVNDAYNLFTEKKGQANNWTIGSYKKHRTIHRHLIAYNSALKLIDVDAARVKDFSNYLHEAGLRNTTIQKDLKFVYEFLNWCEIQGYYHNPKALKDRPRLKGVDGKNRTIIYLSWMELQRLNGYPFKSVKHKQVRDVFCFQCYTGLRYGDVFNLKKTDIQPDKIIITTQKTGERLEIELNKFAKSILAKYDAFPFKGGKALPVISNPKMNEYLKEVCRIAGIDKPITIVYYSGAKRIEETYPKYELIGTHAGRRTFVTNCLTMGIPAEVIMKWTGHKKYEVMKPYLAIVDNLKKQEMDRWNTFSLSQLQKNLAPDDKKNTTYEQALKKVYDED